MIHTASLMHDDVVDESPTRRGASTHISCNLEAVRWCSVLLPGLSSFSSAAALHPCLPCMKLPRQQCFCPICAGKMTVNSRFGAKVAVLAGDFLFAQSSWFLANLDNLEVLLFRAECDSAYTAVYLSLHLLLG